jgi:hypothetical protein
MHPIGCAAFDLNLASAVVEQMVAAFEALKPMPLDAANVATIPAAPGVYQLLHRQQLVYVGQAEGSLRERLDRHRVTLSGRKRLDITDMSYRALIVNRNWSTLATEQALLSHYGRSASWNNSGFGSNDPGRNRDHTAEKAAHFNLKHPIDLTVGAPQVVVSETRARVVLIRLKEQSPFIVRFDESALSSLEGVDLEVPPSATIEQVLQRVGEALGHDWQVSALPGRVLIYPERGVSYPNASVVWPTAPAKGKKASRKSPKRRR